MINIITIELFLYGFFYGSSVWRICDSRVWNGYGNNSYYTVPVFSSSWFPLIIIIIQGLFFIQRPIRIILIVFHINLYVFILLEIVPEFIRSWNSSAPYSISFYFGFANF